MQGMANLCKRSIFVIRRSLAAASRKMATLMNSSFFVFKMLRLRNYRVKYYYIVKRCSGIACDCCASLDIVSILALSTHLSVLDKNHILFKYYSNTLTEHESGEKEHVLHMGHSC